MGLIATAWWSLFLLRSGMNLAQLSLPHPFPLCLIFKGAAQHLPIVISSKHRSACCGLSLSPLLVNHERGIGCVPVSVRTGLFLLVEYPHEVRRNSSVSRFVTVDPLGNTWRRRRPIAQRRPTFFFGASCTHDCRSMNPPRLCHGRF